MLESHLSDRSQRLFTDDVMLEIANLLFGGVTGSILDLLKFGLYLLPLGAFFKYHGIDYHIL